MKALKVLLVLSMLFSLSFGKAFAEKYVFTVLASNGKVEVYTKSAGSWKNLKTGAKLFAEDKVKISPNAYLGLIHKSGKSLTVKQAKEYTVDELAGKVSKSSTVTGRFTQYVLDEMQEKSNLFADDNYKMDVTGSVERGSEFGLPFLGKEGSFRINSPRKVNLLDPELSLKWCKVEGVKKYTLHVTDRFDKELKSFELKDTSYNLNPEKMNLDKDVYYFWYVTTTDNDSRSEDGCFKLLSENSAKAVKDSLGILEKELGDLDNPVSKVMVAYFYEQNSMIKEADETYREAIKLSEGVEDFQKMYDRFLQRQRVNQ